jgi:hypothetical protein
MSFDDAAVRTLLDEIVSHAASLGIFERVNAHEPKNAPGSGLSCSVWADSIDPLARASGLASTSGRVAFNVRIYSSMLAEPQGDIDREILTATSVLMGAYSADFTLGGIARAIDLLGMYGTPLSAKAGYLNHDGKLFRVMEITLPVICNDMWDQSQTTFPGGTPTTTPYLPISGGTLTGPLIISDVQGAPNPGTLPAGRGSSVTLDGLQIVSSHPSDDVGGGTDGTGRILLYSYQRANVSGYGETIRNFLMRWDSKAMTAWYGPVSLYDGAGDAVGGGGWASWSWAGAHYEANDHGSVHGHYEIEVPDAAGAMQGRLIIPFIDDNPSSGVYGQVGITKTNIRINQADLTMDSGWGVIRVGGNAGVNDRVLELASSIYSSNAAGPRWRMLANNTAEGGADAGSDFAIRRFSDTGSLLGTALFVRRSDGQASMGSASPLGARLALVWGGNIHGYSAQPSSSPVTSAAYDAQLTAATDRGFQAMVAADTNRRWLVLADGTTKWGPGNATQDVNLYRPSAGVLRTDNSLAVAGFALGAPRPASSGYLAWNCDPQVTPGAASVGTAKTLYLNAIEVNAAVTTTKGYFIVNASGSGGTAGNNWIGLFDSAGTLVASAGIDAAVTAAQGLFTATWSVSAPLTPGLYWVGIVFNATGMPQLIRQGGAILAAINNNLAAASLRACVNGTNVTTLANITPGSNAQTNAQAYWVAIS